MMPGRKVALLIGCPTGNLVGVKKDLQVTRELMIPHGFAFIEIYDATRNRILQAWEKLINDTSPEDAVVIYYSGHGGRVKKNEDGETESPEHFQFLIPVDFDKTTEDDWRGISSEEIFRLSRKNNRQSKKCDHHPGPLIRRLYGKITWHCQDY